MKTECDALRDDLKAYVDGELSFWKRRRVRQHLSSCAECREEANDMELIRKRLRASDQTDQNTLTPDLKAKLVAGIPAGVPPVATGASAKPKSRKPALVFGTAAIALLGVATYPLLNTNSSEEKSEQKAGFYYGSGQATMAKAKSAPMPADKNIMRDASDPLASPAPKAELSEDAAGQASGSFTLKRKQSAPVTLRGSRAVARKDVFSLAENSTPGIDREVHREANLTVQVDNAEAKSDTVESMTRGEGGYVAENDLSTNDDGTKSATLTLQVPVEKFEKFLASLAKLGEVQAKNVSGKDLTEQIGDEKNGKRTLESEVEELKSQLNVRRLSHLQEKQDREDLRDLKMRIAIKQGRLEMYRKMATLSTLTLSLNEKPKKVAPTQTGGLRGEFGKVFGTAGSVFVGAAKLPLFLLIWIAAYSPLWVPLLLGYRYYSRRSGVRD